MNVLDYWSDDVVAAVAARLGTPTAQRRDDVRQVLYEANAVPVAELRTERAKARRLREALRRG